MEYPNREELIQICKDAVVHHKKWMNRDSYTAQLSVKDIYKGLTSGLDFHVEDFAEFDSYYVVFEQPIDHEKLATGLDLEISSREDYFKDCDPDYESEMFDGDGIDFHSNYTQSYLPTRHRIDSIGIGNDWY